MKETDGDCIRPWDEADAELISAALRWARSKAPSSARNTLAVCERAVRRDDEIPLGAPEAYYVVVPAAERLIMEAADPLARQEERRGRLSLVAGMYVRREGMDSRLAARLENVVAHGVEKRGLRRQWERFLAAAQARRAAAGWPLDENGE